MVGEIYGDNEPCNGFANPPNEIYAVYNDEIKCIGHHEDAHILSYIINRPSSGFIREGLAMYFDKYWWGKKNEQWVQEFLNEGKYISVERLLSDDVFYEYSDAVTYPIAGAFTKFLIDTYGIKKYILLYSYISKDFLKRFKEVYLKEMKDIEEDFLFIIKRAVFTNS